MLEEGWVFLSYLMSKLKARKKGRENSPEVE